MREARDAGGPFMREAHYAGGSFMREAHIRQFHLCGRPTMLTWIQHARLRQLGWAYLPPTTGKSRSCFYFYFYPYSYFPCYLIMGQSY